MAETYIVEIKGSGINLRFELNECSLPLFNETMKFIKTSLEKNQKKG